MGAPSRLSWSSEGPEQTAKAAICFWNIFDGGVRAAPVIDQIPMAKENLVENIPLTKNHFWIMSPFLRDVKEF